MTEVRLIGGDADGRVLRVDGLPEIRVPTIDAGVVSSIGYRVVCPGVAVLDGLDVQRVGVSHPVSWQVEEADPRTVERMAAECLRGIDKWCRQQGYVVIEESVDGSRKWDPLRLVTVFRAEALAYEDEGCYPVPPPVRVRRGVGSGEGVGFLGPGLPAEWETMGW